MTEEGKEGPHGLVLFDMERPLKEGEEEVSRDVVQEEAIKIHSELSPFSGNYRYSVLIVNESTDPITEVKVKIKYPAFLRLSRITPNTIKVGAVKTGGDKRMQVNIDIRELAPGGKRQINLHLEPTKVNEQGNLATFLTYVNAQDYVRVLNSKPVKIHVEPLSVQPKIIPSSDIQRFLDKEGMKKAIKAIGIGVMDREINYDLIFNHLIKILQANHFQVIADDPTQRIAWTFGSELESKEDVLMIGQIRTNKLEFYGASQNPWILIPLLTEIIESLEKRLESLHVIDSEEQIHGLECKKCGMVLPSFPEKGESVQCSNCQYEQVIW